MSETLTGKYFDDIYKSFIKFGDNDVISGSLKVLSDGFGNDLPIQVSSTDINFTGNTTIKENLIVGETSAATGLIEVKGLTSGSVKITVPAVAGSLTYTLPATLTADYYLKTDGSGILSWAAGGSGATLDGVAAAGGNATRNNAAYAIEWQWNTFVGGTNVYGLRFTSNSTVETNTSHASVQGLLGINLTGANAASNVVTKAMYISNLKTGTGAVNYGLHITTSGSVSQLSNPLMVEGHAGGGFIFGSGGTSNKGQFWSNGVTPSITNYAFEVLSGGGVSINTLNGSNINIRFSDSSSTGAIFNNTGFTINNRLNLAGAANGGYGLSVTPATTTGTSVFTGINFTGTHAASSAQSSYYRPLNITYILNNSASGQTGVATGIFLNCTETSLNGMTHTLMNLLVGGVSRLLVSNAGVLTIAGSLNTSAPSGGSTAAWKLGVAASVSPTSPNRTIEVEVAGTTLYISAKTTND